MGIYSDGNIYGIGWRVYDNSDEVIIRFERISEKTILSEQEILEIKTEYENFQNNFQNNIHNNNDNMCMISYTPFYILNADPLGRHLLM